jgi:hypothetical protein
MEVRTTVERSVNITLTQKEAEWLRAVMQNPFCDEENQYEQEMRKKFFDAATLPTDL